MFDDGMELDGDFKIVMRWRELNYCERGSCLKFYIDPPRRYGLPFTFYLPGPERWRQIFPDWAADRREEIVARIKEECAHYHAEWIEG
jgi:hypothetical protein